MGVKRMIFKILILILAFYLGASAVFSQTDEETKIWRAYQKKAEKAVNQSEKIMIYKQFLKKNEHGYYAAEAKRIIEEPNDFEAAKAENTSDSYKAYLAKHPDGEFNHKWEAEIKTREIYFKDKSINDLITGLASMGVTGEYMAEPSPAPFIEKGTLRGDKFKIIILRYEIGDILDIPSIHSSLLKNVHFSVEQKTWTCETTLAMKGLQSVSFLEGNVPETLPNHGAINIGNECKEKLNYLLTFNTKYFETFYLRDDPFFICGQAMDKRLFAKIEEYYESILK